MFVFNMKNLIKTLLLLSYTVSIYGFQTDDDQLLLLSKNGILVYNTMLENYTTIVDNHKDLISLDYDYETQTLFYVNNEIEIVSKNMITNQVKVILRSSSLSINFISVDWVAKNLYFYERGSRLLQVCSFNGENKYALLTKNVANLKGMALSPKYGYIFLIDGNNLKGKVERVDLDGANRYALVDKDILIPNTITVDENENKVYWFDIAKVTVEVISMDGTNRKTIFRGHKFQYIDAMAVLQSKIYFSDYNKLNVFSCDKFNNDDKLCQTKIDRDISVVVKYGKKYQEFSYSGCRKNNGGCSNLCLNNPTSHTCGCPSGYRLLSNGKQCADDIKNKLFLATRKNILLVSMDVKNKVAIELPIKNIRAAMSLDYDDQKEMIYWTDNADNNYGVIKRATINGSVVENFIPPGFTVPDHVAIDHIARQIYWSCSLQAKIYVALMDGSASTVIIKDGLEKPRGLVVDPKYGKLYFSDWGKNPKIESCDLDGSNREVLISSNVTWPNDLAMDYKRRHLYWVDAGNGLVEFYDLINKKRYQIEEQTSGSHMFGITILDDYIYWTELLTRTLYQLNIVTRKYEESVGKIANIMGVTSSKSHVDYGVNACKIKRNGCSHFCFYKPTKGGVCKCPDSFVLDDDRKTCKSADGYLLYSTRTFIKALSIDAISKTSTVPSIVDEEITLVESDSKSGLVIWVDSASHGHGSWSIKSVLLNDSTSMKYIQSGFIGPVDGIAVDWISKNIYWSRRFRSIIEVSRLDGSYRRTVFQRKNKIGLIYVNPLIRKLFWFEGGKGFSQLLSSNLDGSDIKNLHNMSDEPTGITMDTKTNKIFWVSKYKSSIESINSDGTAHKIIIKGLVRPVGLANFRNLLYICEQETKFSVYGSIFSVDKDTGNKKDVLQNMSPQLWFQDLTVMHNDLQTGNNTCSHRNGHCEHICLSTAANTHTCMCEMHYKLNENDLKSCTGPDVFILLSGPLVIHRFSLQADVPEVPLHFQIPINVHSIAYNIQTETVYWLDKNSIKYFTDGAVSIVPLHPDSKPDSFAIDSFTNCLYWSDAEHNTIEFIQLDNPDVKGIIFHNDKYKPRKLQLYPEKGLLFFVNEYLSISDMGVDTIESVYLDGTNRRTLFTFHTKTFVGRNGRYDLAIHHETERMFWLHLKDGVVQSTSIYGGGDVNVEIKFNMKEHTPVAIATYGNYFYWVDFSTEDKFEKLKMRPISVAHGKSITPFQGYYEKTNGLLIVDLKRKNGYHPCQINNGGCSHICYAARNKYGKMAAQCACPLGYTFKKTRHDVCKLDDKDKCSNVCDDDCRSTKIYCKDIIQCEKKYEEVSCFCREGEFRCANNKCIAITKMCNGMFDCPFGEDEKKEECDILAGNRTNTGSVVTPTRYVLIRKHPTVMDDNSKYTAGIISGVILTILIVLCALYVLCRVHYKKLHHIRKQEKLNAAQNNSDNVYQVNPITHRAPNSSVQPKIDLRDYTTVRKSLGSSMMDSFKLDGCRYITGSSTNAAGSILLPLNPPPSICLSDIGRRSVTEQTDYTTNSYYENHKSIPAPPPTPLYSPSDSDSMFTYKASTKQPSLISEQCSQPNTSRRFIPKTAPSYRSSYENRRITYAKKINPSLASSYVSSKNYRRQVRRSSCSSAETLFGKSISRQPSYASGIADTVELHQSHHMALPSIASVNSLSRCSSENSVLKLNYESQDLDSNRDFYNTCVPPPSPGTEYSFSRDTYYDQTDDLYEGDFRPTHSPLEFPSGTDMNYFNDYEIDYSGNIDVIDDEDDEDDQANNFEVEYLLNSSNHQSVNNSLTGRLNDERNNISSRKC